MDLSVLRNDVAASARRLLSEVDRDEVSATRGCFDRRYWAWKLVDFPEATFQRNAWCLAWYILHDAPQAPAGRETLRATVKAALVYATKIQHADGSFDQAFPFERSFGATAFLLHPLLKAYQALRGGKGEHFASVEDMLRRAASFLCMNGERHGHIANHLAGAVLSLVCAADHFGEASLDQRAREILDDILAHGADEGWFQEYDGADPGYQTLCLYYLAQVHELRPQWGLLPILQRAVEFLSWFVHPDGSFGGVYGSRRTKIFYPGGFAVLASEIPLAGRILQEMMPALADGRSPGLRDIDMGNTAPMLENWQLLLSRMDSIGDITDAPSLPCRRGRASADFHRAGLFVRGTTNYYAVLGGSTGGTLTVVRKDAKSTKYVDGGYIGRTESGFCVTTQKSRSVVRVDDSMGAIWLATRLAVVNQALPTPFTFLILRLLNLTVMRNVNLGNAVKRMLVRFLITGTSKTDMSVERLVTFREDRVDVDDTVKGRGNLNHLACGREFVAIHMASARYFSAAEPVSTEERADTDKLSRSGSCTVRFSW